jgi:arginyl-tRNA synthetase
MNVIEQLQQHFYNFLASTFHISPLEAAITTFTINVDETTQQFGDMTSNAAMILAKKLKQNPRSIAQQIKANFKDARIKTIEIAGPGFLNITLTQQTFDLLAQELFEQKATFFKSPTIHKKRINIEFVSANPTGPLHFGHGRGGIIGDVLGNVLSFLGHQVTREFYINDAGVQMKKLGASLKARCEQAAGLDAQIPEQGYHGTYLIDLANELFTQHGPAILDQPDIFFITYAKTKLLEQIKQTLNDYGIQFDVWFSEQTLHESSAIDLALAILEKESHVYQKDDALWFASTKFGDDKDRVLRKKTGELTYAAPDIAYMQDKINRGAEHLIYILGHDHHSYATRLQGMLCALGLERYPLDVILYQLVNIKEGGEQVRMSKRKGNIVTLQDIIDTVGKDVARFFYLNRKADAQLEFDIELALKHTDENPVYYIQYAYVRTGSILDNAEKETVLQHITAKDLANLTPADDFLVKKIVTLKDILLVINNSHQTHLLAYYTHELAQAFNRYYSKNRVIDLSNIAQSRARLALVMIVRHTFKLCLDLMELSKPERM